jgi:hypothetical protein
LATPLEVARTLPVDLLRMMGYARGAYALGYVGDSLDPMEVVRPGAARRARRPRASGRAARAVGREELLSPRAFFRQIQAHVAKIADDGYTIVENAIEPDFLESLHEDLLRLERELAVEPHANDFEGAKTVRIYNLLVHGKLWERVPVHENVLPIVEGVLDAGCLVSSLSSIAIGPDEKPQPIHADDQLIPIPKPTRRLCATRCGRSPSSRKRTAPRASFPDLTSAIIRRSTAAVTRASRPSCEGQRHDLRRSHVARRRRESHEVRAAWAWR